MIIENFMHMKFAVTIFLKKMFYMSLLVQVYIISQVQVKITGKDTFKMRFYTWVKYPNGPYPAKILGSVIK